MPAAVDTEALELMCTLDACIYGTRSRGHVGYVTTYGKAMACT